LASPYRKVREKAVTYITECMELANKLNCSIVQAGWAFQGSRLEAPYEITWRNAVRSLKEVGRRAINHGVKFVIEYQNKKDAKLVNTMDDALRILDEVGYDNVLIMADTFHMNLEDPSLEESILKADKRLGYVHLADSDRLAPGEGSIDFRGFIRALRKIRYEGYLVMEFEPKPNPDDALGRAIKFIGSLL
ncbi:MAG: sugar phosphate isomerase/epimerase family protein, partial [Candidatus Bathyarchaeia archaeon]